MTAGKTFAFLGRNGAGKTTAIRLMLGLLRRDLESSILAPGALAMVSSAVNACYDQRGARPTSVSTTMFGLAAIACPLLAWGALKRDWGWSVGHR